MGKVYAAEAFLTEEVISLDRYAVNGAGLEDYASPRFAVAGKASIPVELNPQSISVVSEALLADWRPLKLEDALVGVAGVATGGYYDDWDYLRIRGFDVSLTETYIDGLRAGGGFIGMNAETFGVSRIEILKGPAALYGSGSVGGLVNLVSKRPVSDRFAWIETSFGSHDFIEGTLDLNQPLTTSGSVAVRLLALARDRNSHIPMVGSRRFHVAPSVTWRISDESSLTVYGTFNDREGTLAWPLPAEGTVLPNPNGRISPDLYIGEPNANFATEQMAQLGFEFTHSFTPNVSVVQSFRVDDLEATGKDLLYPRFLSPDKTMVYRSPWSWDESVHALASDTRFTATFGSEAVAHQLSAGLDHYRRTQHNIFEYNWTNSDAVPIHLFAPVYTGTIPAADAGYSEDLDTRLTGLYLQDHVSLSKRVTLTLGGRYDFTEIDGTKEEAFSGRFGATWEARDGVILYASFSESFNAQWGTTADGDSLQPEEGVNYEAGVRAEFLEGRLRTTTAVYEITRQNLATADLANPGYSLTTGEQCSRGVEFDFRAAPMKGWEILGAYAYTDTAVTADNRIAVGTRMAGVPLHAFSTWTKYTVQSGAFRGFGIGVGANYYSRQDGDRTYTTQFYLPAYTLWRSALYYERGRFRAQVNVTNVFDKEHFVGAYDAMYVGPGAPRSVRVTLGWRF